MSSPITITHISKIKIERMEKKDGWAISEFRLPITGNDGSATAVFHSIFRPGSTHAKHLHKNCDEIAVYLKGHGVVGQSNSRAEVTNGNCRLMPRGTEHFFYNETKEEDVSLLRNKYFDIAVRLYKSEEKAPSEITENTRFLSGKRLIEGGKEYLSYAHWKKGLDNNNTVIDSPDYWKELEHFYIYEQHQDS